MENLGKKDSAFLRLLFLFTFSVIFLLAVRKEFHLATDAGFLIRTGQEIVETGQIPARDPFSHTLGGQTWYLDRWAPCVFYYLLYHWFGISGAILIKALLVAGGFFLLAIMLLREKRDPLLVSAALVLGALAARNRFDLRPQVISMLIFAGQIYLTRYCWENRGSRAGPAGLVLLLVFWANLHSEWIYGISYLGLVGFSEAGEKIYRRFRSGPGEWDFRYASILFVVFFLSVFLSLLTVQLINPNGWEVLLLPFRMAFSNYWHTTVYEFGPVYSPYLDLFILTYAVVLALGLILDFRKVGLQDAVITLFFGILTVRHNRLTHAFVFATLPILVRHWDRVLRGFWSRVTEGMKTPEKLAGRVRMVLKIELLAVMVLVGYLWVGKDPSGTFGIGFDQNNYPAGAFKFIAEENLSGKLFNEADLGGALILFFYPRLKVFADGRYIDLYDDQFDRLVYLHILYGFPYWEALLDRYQVDYILLSPFRFPNLREGIGRSKKWQLIYPGSDALIFARNTEENSRVHGRPN